DSPLVAPDASTAALRPATERPADHAARRISAPARDCRSWRRAADLAPARRGAPSHPPFSFHDLVGGHRGRDGHAVFEPRDEPRRISWVVAGNEMADAPKVALGALGKVQVHDR